MTSSPISIRAGPFIDGIVDYSHQYSVEESVVLIVHNSDEVTSDFHMFASMDSDFINLFIISFLVVLVLFVISMDKIFVLEEFLHKTGKIFLNLILPIFNQGIFL